MGSSESRHVVPVLPKEHCATPLFVPDFDRISRVDDAGMIPSLFVVQVLDPSTNTRFDVQMSSQNGSAVIDASFWLKVEAKLQRSVKTIDVKQGAPEKSSQAEYPGWDARIRFGANRESGIVCAPYLIDKDKVVVDVVVDVDLVDNYRGWCYF